MIANILVLNADEVPDDSGDIFDVNGISYKESVPVKLGFEQNAKIIGRAILKTEGTKVLADIDLFETVPEIEFYPCIGGRVLERDENKTIKKCEIQQLSLEVIGPNSDHRIGKIKLENV